MKFENGPSVTYFLHLKFASVVLNSVGAFVTAKILINLGSN